MTIKLPFKQVDVFTKETFKGNPVAIVFDANGLTTSQMQQISHWTNLSETVFVLAPTSAKADYRVRIFSPFSELDFAGHPSVGSCHAVLEAGIVTSKPTIIQECRAGLVEMSVSENKSTGRSISFKLARFSSCELNQEQLAEVSKILKYNSFVQRPLLINSGPNWITVQFQSTDDVLSCHPDYQQMEEFTDKNNFTGVTIFAKYQSGEDIEVRSFAPGEGVKEDPVCGSGNAAVAVYLKKTGQVKEGTLSLNSKQGQKLNRNGLLKIEVEGESYKVGGQAITVIDGSINI